MKKEGRDQLVVILAILLIACIALLCLGGLAFIVLFGSPVHLNGAAVSYYV